VRKDISQTDWLIVIALLLVAFALRTIDLVRVPPGLHNDEVVEIQITERVANGRIGVFFPEDTGHETLYYYFAAPFLRVFGHDSFGMRLPAVFLSMVGMSVIFSLTCRLLGRMPALISLGGFAVVFWTVTLGRIISHVPMELPMAALAAYCFWRARPVRGVRAAWLHVLSGVCLGLAINAYTAARILPVIFAAFGLYTLLWHRETWRDWWKRIGLTLLAAAVTVLPLAIYLFRHPGADQLSFFDINRPLIELRNGNIGPVIRTSLRTLGMFAFFGDPLPYFDVPGRPVLDPVGALLLGIGLLIALWRWRQPEYAFLVLWFLLALVPGMLSQPAPSYTRTIGAQVVLFAFPGMAISVLLEHWRHSIVRAALVLLFVGNLMWTGYSYFIVWPSVDTVQFWHQSGLKAIADRLQTDPDRSPVAVCVPDHLLNERADWWKPAPQHMRYLLDRPDLSLRYYNCADAMVVSEGPMRYAFPDVASMDELKQFPVYDLLLSESDYTVEFMPRALGVILSVDRLRDLNERLNDVVTDSAVYWAWEGNAYQRQAQAPINFEDRVQFLGYTTSSGVLKPGAAFAVTTWWRVVGALPSGLVQFTHVLDREQTLVAQQDRLAFTSGSLREGDVFAQIHELSLPHDLAEGEHTLSIGLYTPSDGARLQISQGNVSRGDRLYLEPIVVKR